MSEDNKNPNEEFEKIVSQGESDLQRYARGEGELPVSDDKTPEDKPATPSQNDAEQTNDTSSTPSSDDTSSGGNEENTAPQPESTPQPENNSQINIGVSRAYGGIPDTDIYGKPKEPKAPKQPPKKPERPKNSKVADAKNIMELFWKEFILKSYGWCVDFCVDSVLDLTDFIFFPDADDVKEEKKNVNIFSLGQKMRDSTREKLTERKDVCLKGYQEFLNNLEKDKKGEDVKWFILKKEPSFFKEISEINKKENKTEDEEQLIYMVKNPPLEQMISDGIKMHDISMASATCEVASDKENGYIISENFANNMKQLKNFITQNSATNTSETITSLIEELEGCGKSVAPIKQGLSTINEAVISKDTKKAKKEYEEVTKAIEKLTSDPAFWEARILKTERQYFSLIEKSIEDIYSNENHTVSEGFTKQLIHLNRITSSGDLTARGTKDESMRHLNQMISSLDQNQDVQKELLQELNKISTQVQNNTTGTVDSAIKEGIEKINTIHTENSPQAKARKEFFETLATSIRKSKKAYDNCSGVVGSVMHSHRVKELNKTIIDMRRTFSSVTPSQRTSTGINPFEVYNTILNSVEK